MMEKGVVMEGHLFLGGGGFSQFHSTKIWNHIKTHDLHCTFQYTWKTWLFNVRLKKKIKKKIVDAGMNYYSPHAKNN